MPRRVWRAGLLFKHHQHPGPVVNRGDGIFHNGQRFHDEMQTFPDDETFGEKSSNSRREPDPNRMLVKFNLKSGGNPSERLKITGELFEIHLLETMFQKAT